MALRLRRNLTGPDALEPGEYFVDVLKADIGAAFTVYVACECGARSVLPPSHVVQKGGAVVPALRCASCGSNQFLLLEGFGEPT